MNISNWIIKDIDTKKAEEIAQCFNLSPLATKVLVARGYDSYEKIEEFLYCDEMFYSPFLLNDMEKAVERIFTARDNNEFVVVYGDYDCDGISSSALLTSYLNSIGINAKFYIPSRKLGFGLNNKSLQILKEKGADLIITVDNGITATQQVDFANSIGLDIIITDHHTPGDSLPNAVAAINPHRKDCDYPFKNLAGVGVVLKLISALEGDEEGIQTAYNYSYLAGIGTVADIVELQGENSAIVKMALETINESDFCGVNALIDTCRISGRLNSTNIAFMIGPRINAAGRVGIPSRAVDLLMCSDDESAAKELARIIDGYNTKRKTIENEIYKQVLEKINSNKEILNERVLIVEGENWDLGVIGIVCAKLVSKYRKPCILIGYDETEARGSARSVYGYDIIGAISSCCDYLTKYGGHKMAAGFSLDPENINSFKEQIYSHARENYDIMPTLAVQIDCKVDINEINIETIGELSCLEPYGEGNPHPVFLTENLPIEEVTPLSGGKHTKLIFSRNGLKIDGLCFGSSTENFPYEKGDVVDVVISSDINEYNGNISVSNIVKDIKYSLLDKTKINMENGLYEKFLRNEALNYEDTSHLIPLRDEIAKIYIYIRSKKQVKNNISYLLSKFEELGYFKLKIIIDTLVSEHLIEKRTVGAIDMLVYVENPQKVDLENSEILKRLKKLV